MEKLYICNAFSLSMLPEWAEGVSTKRLSSEEARQLVNQFADKVVSAIGHADTCQVFRGILNAYLEPNRVSVQLDRAILALVGQYQGPRLPEGATCLPEGASIQWFLIEPKHVLVEYVPFDGEEDLDF